MTQASSEHNSFPSINAVFQVTDLKSPKVTPHWCSFRWQLLPSCCSRWSRCDWWMSRSCVMTSAPSGRQRWLRWAQPEPDAQRRTSGRCWWRSAEDQSKRVQNSFLFISWSLMTMDVKLHYKGDRTWTTTTTTKGFLTDSLKIQHNRTETFSSALDSGWTTFACLFTRCLRSDVVFSFFFYNHILVSSCVARCSFCHCLKRPLSNNELKHLLGHLHSQWTQTAYSPSLQNHRIEFSHIIVHRASVNLKNWANVCVCYGGRMRGELKHVNVFWFICVKWLNIWLNEI